MSSVFNIDIRLRTRIYINYTFQNKVLRIITKLWRVAPIAILHEQTGMSLIRSHIKKLARALCQKSGSSENSQTLRLSR
jgi:hypothetical protein